MIDLHTHTTASDGGCTPAELVARASAAGVRVLSVTDHDTVAGCEEAAQACRAAGIDFVPGIEITAIVDGADLHVLGYFIDRGSATLAAFLSSQRQSRLDRVREMIVRLAEHGVALDADEILRPALLDPSRSAGRPWIARALVAGGHVSDTQEAFARWLQRGRPAFVPRRGPSPDDAFRQIREAGGVSSLAHPGLVRRDDWIPGLAESGLDALEAYHSEHDAAATRRYVAFAARLNLGVSGGSDYHADETHGAPSPGSVALPLEDFERLKSRRPRQ